MQIDHVTVGAADLGAGARFLKSRLNIDIPAGGKHPLMSTHNRVVRTGEGMFLELIAVDPDAPPPSRPRWFSLDEPVQSARLARCPGPIAWVVRTDDLTGVLARSPVDLGPAMAMTRGELSWKLTIAHSGVQPVSGLIPAFIEWDGEPHPSAKMAFLGPTLKAVVLRHPRPGELEDMLHKLGIAHLAEVEHASEASLAFSFELPGGDLVTIE